MCFKKLNQFWCRFFVGHGWFCNINMHPAFTSNIGIVQYCGWCKTKSDRKEPRKNRITRFCCPSHTLILQFFRAEVLVTRSTLEVSADDIKGIVVGVLQDGMVDGSGKPLNLMVDTPVSLWNLLFWQGIPGIFGQTPQDFTRPYRMGSPLDSVAEKSGWILWCMVDITN